MFIIDSRIALNLIITKRGFVHSCVLKIWFHSYLNKTHFHVKRLVLSFAFVILKVKETWLIKIKDAKLNPLANNCTCSTHFYSTYLHQNCKVCQMITGAHNFGVRFVDQRASSCWPGTVESASAQTVIAEYMVIKNWAGFVAWSCLVNGPLRFIYQWLFLKAFT